jgi:hypothetical protein
VNALKVMWGKNIHILYSATSSHFRCILDWFSSQPKPIDVLLYWKNLTGAKQYIGGERTGAWL